MKLEQIGVTPQKERQFNKKGIYSTEDLSLFFPRKYIDCTKDTGIQNEEFSIFSAYFTDIKMYKDDFFIARGVVNGTKDRIGVTWFRQTYLYHIIEEMLFQSVVVAGRPIWNEEYKNYSLSSPFLFLPDNEKNRKIYPVYSKIQGMSEEYLKGKVNEALLLPDRFPDPYPDEDFPSYYSALCEIHFPSSSSSLQKAEEKVAFNDLSYFHERIEKTKEMGKKESCFKIKTITLAKKIQSSLPYSLTEDQRGTLNRIYGIMKSGKRVNALIQGDVGTGKSIIAFLLMTIMGENGYQSVIMAPTQVLAKQHYEELSSLLSSFGEKVMYCGEKGLNKKEKEEIKEGKVKYIVGTHAVLNKTIEYNNLALCIVDEEHRFGVLQREALTEKTADGIHSISMSATPIPRSLASVIYGTGVELCTIKTKPAGRLPVKTASTSSLSSVFSFLKKEIEKGRQAYVVCPAIEKSEKLEGVLSVEEVTEIYKKNLPFLKIETLTGRNKKSETEEIIGRYKEGKTDILISTTVIEVGVNVPNASVMVIQNAERFGLAGLHQLRGRVGRGKHQSYCVLVSEDKENPRLKIMCETTDGFKIAEEDLKLRGTGELIGLKQSGYDKYVSLMIKFPQIWRKIEKEKLP